ncbi:MAG: hypothetical protein AB7F89_16390 [Pirellulaceae bacterium]
MGSTSFPVVPQTVAGGWSLRFCFYATVGMPVPNSSLLAARQESLGNRLSWSHGHCRAQTQVWLI